MQSQTPTFSALVLGATGEVGKAIVNQLSKIPQFDRVRLVTRRAAELPTENRDKFDQVTIEDFDKLSDHSDAFKDINVTFCALGTTRAKSGLDGQYKVDHDYIVEAAKLSYKAGVSQFHLISSTGANKDSWFFYPKTKGQTEADVSSIGIPQVVIYRPALLLTEREEYRLSERLLQTIMRPLDFWRLASVDVPDLARVVVQNALNRSNESPVQEILENSHIVTLSKQYPATF